MNYVYPLLVAAGGALGALCRYMTTLALAGLLGVLLSRVYPLPGAAAFLITGFLGGLTTFSSFMNETLQFWAAGRWMEGLGYIFAQLACGILLVALGAFLAEKIFL